MDKKRIIQNKTAVGLGNDKQAELKALVDRFAGNIKQYEDKNYKEARTRVDFIDPFFELLGWDLGNKQGFSEAYRDVIREDEVMVAGKQKAPDYCFKIGVEKKFFVEAKKPSINIKDDIGSAYQLRRYAYSAKLPLSILTDFHEFAVYDTRIKPKPKDKAEVARIFYCKFDEYEQNFAYLYNTFSKNAILKGSFDRYVADKTKKKGTSEVDKEFLKLIETWRNDLAKNIAINNIKLDLFSLNTSVQKIIDRIIFLRIAEARNIEEDYNLSKIAESNNVYKKLDEYFQQADKKYNSGLFKIETWLSGLKIDDKILKSIISSTYYPESPYEFSVLPVEILGNIYEQFLGKVIHLTASHQAKIEEKPEVKKAGGVYYTPQYIVDYIVKNTVGEKLNGSNPEKVEALKILDPACGSGSFLLGAYAYLLRWHLDYYTKDKKSLEKYKKAGKIYDYKGDFKLTIDEKKKILKNNIFGVDIDSQAVEVTKLSLLLKLMENETQQSAGMLIKYSHEALLPDLSDNIKCGNSLIGTDFYGGKNMSLFGNDEMRKVNAFDWEKEFKNIFDNGGFDVVIGNPPYLAFQEGNIELKNYFKNNFSSAFGKYDQYILFVEKSLLVFLNKNGFFSFIIPNKFIHSSYGKGIKKILLKFKIDEILDFNDLKVFGNATNYPCVIKITKILPSGKLVYKIVNNIENDKFFVKSEIKVNQGALSDDTWLLIDEDKKLLLNKLIKDRLVLDNFATAITQGIRTGALEIFINNHNNFSENRIEKDLLIPIYNGKNVKRYYCGLKSDDLLLFPYQKSDYQPVDISRFPNAKKYLENFRVNLLNRKDSNRVFKDTKKVWFTYWDNKPECFKSPKIIFPDISSRNNFYLDMEGIGFINTCYTIFLKNDNDYKLILGILNSRVVEYFIRQTSPFVRGGYYRYKTNYIKKIPIPIVPEIVRSRINNFVDQMLEVQKKFHSAKTEADKKLYQQKIEILDGQIDGEVYKLYGLTEEDINIVEGK